MCVPLVFLFLGEEVIIATCSPEISTCKEEKKKIMLCGLSPIIVNTLLLFHLYSFRSVRYQSKKAIIILRNL